MVYNFPLLEIWDLFYMVELHAAFAALKIIRKYINFKDTDIGLLKAGMYGINATEENRDDSWGKEEIEANMIVFFFHIW